MSDLIDSGEASTEAKEAPTTDWKGAFNFATIAVVGVLTLLGIHSVISYSKGISPSKRRLKPKKTKILLPITKRIILMKIYPKKHLMSIP